MPAIIERPEIISAPLVRAVPTGSDDQSPVSRTRAREYEEGWQRVITDTLENWLRNPGQLADIGIEPPAGRIIRLALDVAETYKNSRLIAAPERIVPDPNGGIVFETQDGQVLEVVHIWDDGAVEYMKFDGARLIRRQPLWGGN